MKTVLGIEDYARYCDDYREQTQLRDMLKDKPDEITEYERRLKAATFAYNKADNKSVKGQQKTAQKMFNYTDGLFERLAEYLSEKIAGHRALETWFDRPLATGVEDSFGLDPDSFPKIITSRTLNNKGGGYLANKRTIREVKMDAVQRVVEELTAPEQEIVVEITDQMARFKRLRQLSRE